MTPSFPISAPIQPLRKLATITHRNNGGLSVFWDENSRYVYFHVTSHAFQRKGFVDEWWFQEDGNICDSLADFVDEIPSEIYFNNIFLFRKPGHGKAADDQLMLDIYDCDWSDFACEKMSLEFNVCTHHNLAFLNKWERAGQAFAEAYCPYEPELEDIFLFAEILRNMSEMGKPIQIKAA
jgi:hypothetical protein